MPQFKQKQLEQNEDKMVQEQDRMDQEMALKEKELAIKRMQANKPQKVKKFCFVNKTILNLQRN